MTGRPNAMIHPREVLEMLRQALAAVRTHVLRSSLTLLGVLVGVFSIIAVMTAIRVLQSNLEGAMSGLGANTLQFSRRPAIVTDDMDWQKFMRRRRFLIDDVHRLRARIPEDVAVAARASFASGEASSRYARTTGPVNGEAVTPEGFVTQTWVVASGRPFTESDDDAGRRVCVLGADLAERLFPFGVASALGESVKYLGVNYTVVGILERRGSLFGMSRDSFIAVPLGTALRQVGRDLSLVIQVQAPDQESFAATVELCRGVMRAQRKVPPGEEDDFEVTTNDSAVTQFRSMTQAVRLGAAAISSIALVAAGIGIMNIMLVSVTERTREIGIRRAIGAKKRGILMQFVAEAVLLSQVGGVLGVLLGIGFGNLMCLLVKAPPVVPLDWALIGLGICSAVGILFGTYPAWKAANLDPIESLRYE